MLEFESVELQLNPFTILMGENGCGKTTLLQAIALALRIYTTTDLIKYNDRIKKFTFRKKGVPYTMLPGFEIEDLMTMIRQGPFDGIQDLPKEGDGVHRGIKRLLTTPSYASAYFTAPYDPALAATALTPYAKGTIGLVSTYQMSCALADHLRKEFPQATFVDAKVNLLLFRL